MNADRLHLRWLALAFFIVGVLLLLPVFTQAQTSDKIIISYCSGSQSMGGAFYKGRKMAIAPLPYAELKPGLIVAREVRDRHGKLVAYVSHRLVRRDGPLWVMKGDNNLTNDREDFIRLNPDNYAGVYVDPDTLQPL